MHFLKCQFPRKSFPISATRALSFTYYNVLHIKGPIVFYKAYGYRYKNCVCVLGVGGGLSYDGGISGSGGRRFHGSCGYCLCDHTTNHPTSLRALPFICTLG